MRSGLRFCEKLAVIDAHAAGQTEPVQVQRVGPDLVFSRLWEVLQLGTRPTARPSSSTCESNSNGATRISLATRVTGSISRPAGGEHFTIDEKIREEARYDGKGVLQTNLADEPKIIALAYKELWKVEDMFRTMKSICFISYRAHKHSSSVCSMGHQTGQGVHCRWA